MAVLALSRMLAVLVLPAAALGACSHLSQGAPPVVLSPSHSNAISHWHDIAAATLAANVPSKTTDAEKYSAFPADMATMHLAMYDAAMAIKRRYRPFLYAPPVAPDASVDAATGAAAYEVLRALFPGRASHYEDAYRTFVAGIPDSAAKTRGLAIGAASAAAHLQKRATDGRAEKLPSYASNGGPGRFQGTDPINRFWPRMRPFVLTSSAQFRPPAPPALTSVQYTADFQEVKALGGKASARRTPEQLETARFHSEPPLGYFTRNFGRFARTTADPYDAARLMGAIYANYTDAISACLEAKYYYDTWRPQTAIPMADADGNPATVADPDWKPAYTTPNHPEYPAAHSCSAGTLGELLRLVYGTDKVTYTWDSKVSGTSRTYTDTDALAEESKMARIYGGMHFRYATVAGAQLGKQVAQWTMRHAFMPEP